MHRPFLSYLFLLFGLLGAQELMAQTTISGTVLDSLENPLIGATILLTHQQDSLLEGFALTDPNGNFEVVAKTPDTYSLQITFVGYGTFARRLTISSSDVAIPLGRIVLNPTAYQLEGATVTDSFIPIVIKKDTIEYNADAFKTKPNAVVEDLLKKLPGIEVENDGTIKAQGEEVQNILVDGKEFFGDDPKIASKNIPADIVDKVQLFDKASDFSEFTGIADGNEEKTINLAIKEGKNKGLFGNVSGAYGVDDRYRGKTNLNRFNENMQLSFIGNVNNINEQAFSITDYFQFMGGMEDVMSGGDVDFSFLPTNLMENSGESDVYAGGLNFNYDFSKKTDLRSNYFFDLSDNITQTESNLQNLLAGGSFNTQTIGTEETNLGNHRMQVKLDHRFDPTQDLRFRTNLSYSDNENGVNGTSQSLFNQALTNESQRQNQGQLTSWNWRTELTYRKKLKKPGRFFTSSLRLDGQSNESDFLINNQNRFFEGGQEINLDTSNQLQLTDGEKLNYKLDLNYVEPLGKSTYLSVRAVGQNRESDRSRLFFDGSFAEDAFLNNQLSSQFVRGLFQSEIGTSIKKVGKNYNWSIGLAYQNISLDNDDLTNQMNLNRSFRQFLPSARFDYEISKSHTIRATYRTRVQIPSVEQLQPLVDNRDPLNINIGNPDLDPEYIHELDLNYSKFDAFYFRSIFAGVRLMYVQNNIVSFSTIDEQLRRVQQPINSSDQWMLSSYYNFSNPFTGIDLKLELNGNIRFQQNDLLINDIIDRSSIWNTEQTVQLENKYKENVDWAIGYTLGWINTTYTASTSFNQSFFQHTYFTNFGWDIGDNWAFNLDASFQDYSDEESFGDGQQLFFLNATLNKGFADNKWTVFVEGNNLLDEQLQINRNSVGTQLFESIKNRIGRYVLLGVSYKLSSFGK